MRILHTADWHLGKRLERFSRLPEQERVLDEICEIADREAVHAVVIAGDIFDTYNPPTEAIDLFYRTAKRLASDGSRAVLAIAGNHDSPDRIEAPDPLARECGIILAGYPDSCPQPFRLGSGLAAMRTDSGFIELAIPGTHAPLRVLFTPYANEVRLRTCLGFSDETAEMQRILKGHWERLAEAYCREEGINILTAHLVLLRKTAGIPAEPESEKPILHIGGAPALQVQAIPSVVQYTALGHLHEHQVTGKRPCPVVYSGSPLAYSMAEAGQHKSVTLVDLEPGRPAGYREVKLNRGKQLLRSAFGSVDEALRWLTDHEDALVEITLRLDSYLSAQDRQRLSDAHDGLVAIIPHLSKAGNAEADDLQQIDPGKQIDDLFIDYFQHRHGEPPNEEVLELFKEVLAGDRR